MGAAMRFLDQCVRVRARRTADPYNADRLIEDWVDPLRLDLSGFFDEDSSQDVADAVRKQKVSRMTLYLPTSADVLASDRIERTVDGVLEVWSIDGEHESPRNPFTNRRPYRAVKIWKAVG